MRLNFDAGGKVSTEAIQPYNLKLKGRIGGKATQQQFWEG
jgi:hypothetical protein